MRVLIFGSTGMLGSALQRQGKLAGVELAAVPHSRVDITNSTLASATIQAYRPDVVINAAGVIPVSKRSPEEMIRANAIGPHTLAAACVAQGVRLIHVSTDCVFSGHLRMGMQYGPTDEVSPVDPYGWSKALGEPVGPGVTVVRTSFMGPEHGLWHWARSHAVGESIPGWRYAYWSGSTVDAVAKALLRIADARARSGTYHLATNEPISKYHVLKVLNGMLKLGLNVERVEGPAINRGLDHSRGLCTPLPPFEEALDDYIRAAQER